MAGITTTEAPLSIKGLIPGGMEQASAVTRDESRPLSAFITSRFNPQTRTLDVTVTDGPGYEKALNRWIAGMQVRH